MGSDWTALDIQNDPWMDFPIDFALMGRFRLLSNAYDSFYFLIHHPCVSLNFKKLVTNIM